MDENRFEEEKEKGTPRCSSPSRIQHFTTTLIYFGAGTFGSLHMSALGWAFGLT